MARKRLIERAPITYLYRVSEPLAIAMSVGVGVAAHRLSPGVTLAGVLGLAHVGGALAISRWKLAGPFRLRSAHHWVLGVVCALYAGMLVLAGGAFDEQATDTELVATCLGLWAAAATFGVVIWAEHEAAGSQDQMSKEPG